MFFSEEEDQKIIGVFSGLEADLGKKISLIVRRAGKLCKGVAQKYKNRRLTIEEINMLRKAAVETTESPVQICLNLKIDSGIGRYHVIKAREQVKSRHKKNVKDVPGEITESLPIESLPIESLPIESLPIEVTEPVVESVGKVLKSVKVEGESNE